VAADVAGVAEVSGWAVVGGGVAAGDELVR